MGGWGGKTWTWYRNQVPLVVWKYLKFSGLVLKKQNELENVRSSLSLDVTTEKEMNKPCWQSSRGVESGPLIPGVQSILFLVISVSFWVTVGMEECSKILQIALWMCFSFLSDQRTSDSQLVPDTILKMHGIRWILSLLTQNIPEFCQSRGVTETQATPGLQLSSEALVFLFKSGIWDKTRSSWQPTVGQFYQFRSKIPELCESWSAQTPTTCLVLKISESVLFWVRMVNPLC